MRLLIPIATLLSVSALSANPLFHPPVLLSNQDGPAESEKPGYASPCLADVDGDGKDELLVGQFAGGNIAIYKINSLTAKKNQLGKKSWLRINSKRAEVPGVWWCTSSTPQFVDLDGDGIKDIITGNYVTNEEKGIASVHIFKGLSKGKYAKIREVKNKNNKPVIAIKVDDSDEGYDSGQICIHPYAADWDADGDLDLIIGNFEGSFTLVLNEKQGPGLSFASKGTILKDKHGEKLIGDLHSAPILIDWDNDGDLDLVSSFSTTQLCVAINSGTAKKPVLEPFKTLIAAPKQMKSNSKISIGNSFRPWVADVNGDGKLDVLIGDSSTIETPNPKFTKAQITKKQAAWEQAMSQSIRAMETLEKQAEKLEQAGKNPDNDRKFSKLYDKASQKQDELFESRSEFIDSRSTGHVWLYLAK